MQCLTCDDQPGMKTPVEDGVIECAEVCGDGYNYGKLACDDGNLANGDGCSRYCLIESGYACFGGTTTRKDECYDVTPPVPTLDLISSKNTLYITFDEEV